MPPWRRRSACSTMCARSPPHSSARPPDRSSSSLPPTPSSMNPALRTAASGMMAQQTRTEVIANNLANVNTTAFERSRAQFQDLLYQTVQSTTVIGSPDANTSAAIQVGRGTHLSGVLRMQAQGTLEQTGRPLDVAI